MWVGLISFIALGICIVYDIYNSRNRSCHYTCGLTVLIIFLVLLNSGILVGTTMYSIKCRETLYRIRDNVKVNVGTISATGDALVDEPYTLDHGAGINVENMKHSELVVRNSIVEYNNTIRMMEALKSNCVTSQYSIAHPKDLVPITTTGIGK